MIHTSFSVFWLLVFPVSVQLRSVPNQSCSFSSSFLLMIAYYQVVEESDVVIFSVKPQVGTFSFIAALFSPFIYSFTLSSWEMFKRISNNISGVWMIWKSPGDLYLSLLFFFWPSQHAGLLCFLVWFIGFIMNVVWKTRLRSLFSPSI